MKGYQVIDQALKDFIGQIWICNDKECKCIVAKNPELEGKVTGEYEFRRRSFADVREIPIQVA